MLLCHPSRVNCGKCDFRSKQRAGPLLIRKAAGITELGGPAEWFGGLITVFPRYVVCRGSRFHGHAGARVYRISPGKSALALECKAFLQQARAYQQHGAVVLQPNVAWAGPQSAPGVRARR